MNKQGRIMKVLPVLANDPEIKNVLIYPAKTKVAIDDPYFTCYYYLQECLSNARIAIFIGYSFSDYDVLTKIKGSFISNPELKIIILDPNANSIIREYFGENKSIIPITLPFGNKSHEEDYINDIDVIIKNPTEQRTR